MLYDVMNAAGFPKEAQDYFTLKERELLRMVGAEQRIAEAVAAVCTDGAEFLPLLEALSADSGVPRYASDMIPGFLLAAVIIWISVLDRANSQCNYDKWSRLVTVFTICGLAFAFLTFIAKGDSVCLLRNNIPLFYNIGSYFKF